MKRVLLALLVVAGASCPMPDPVLENDAGDEAFVHSAVWLMWGRRPSSLAERDVLVRMLQDTDRAAFVRELATTDEYVDRWQDFVYDALAVNRNGDRANSLCYRIGTRADDDLELAPFVAATDGADTTASVEPWTLRDLTRSALRVDDLSPLFRAVLYPNAAMPGVPPNLLEAMADRRDFASVFLGTHLGRTSDCLPCHNSDGSVTDAEDPEEDRFWPLPGSVEAAVFGAPEGGDADALGIFFRRHGVGHGFRIDEFGQFARYPPIDLEGGPIPEGFDGCAGLENAATPGCDGCACEPRVCAVDPGCCEEKWDDHCAQACIDATSGDCPYHQPEDTRGPYHPWNMHDGCGDFVHPDGIEDDPSDGDGWFAGSYGAAASAYDLDAALRVGFDELAASGMTDPSPSGPAAAARMIAARFVDRVWAEAFGSPLTISHGFPRNEPQQERLLALSDAFATGGWSLIDVLVEVATDPLFNQPLPAAVEGESTYYMPPVIDPWSVEAEDPEKTANGIGDRVHRPDPRVLLRAARTALGWRPAEGFPITTASFHGSFQARIGAYLNWSEPGFEGIDLQWQSAWEARLQDCVEPVWELKGDGCEARPEQNGCVGCDCFQGVCEERPQCCTGPWDAACAESCRRFNACPIDDTVPPDWIDALLEVAQEQDATWEAVVSTLKMRLLADPSLGDPEERALLEEVLGADLTAPVTASDRPEDGLRAVCGGMLTSGSFLLAGLPPAAVEAPPPGVAMPGEGFADHCERLSATLFPGRVTCRGDTLTVR